MLFLKFVVLTELADQREPLILLHGHARRFFSPVLMDYFQKRLFSKIMVWKRQFTVTIATYKADGYLTATMGDSKQGGLKMYFHSYWCERLRLLSWKNKLTPTQRRCKNESWQSLHVTASRVLFFGGEGEVGFSFFVVVFALFIFSLRWHNSTCPGRIAQQLTLPRFNAENTLSVVFSGLGLVPAEHPSLPLRNGRDGMMGFPCHESMCCLLWAECIWICLAVCVQGTVYF